MFSYYYLVLTFNDNNNEFYFKNLQNLHKSKVSTAEMLLGLQMRDTGLKRYPIRVRPRVIQYAITIVLRENDQNYLSSLKQKLYRLYPLHQQNENANKQPTTNSYNNNINNNQPISSQQRSSIMYIYYPGEFNLLEFMPLCAAFMVLFTYVYFSTRKIDVIKSRFVLALFAVLTVLSSLMMSLGLCFFFGLTISMQSKGVFQYLVILVGLENVLVITKSVLSTDNTFDVKIRVAQGLSKEGWTISKTLLTEITILTIGLATFVPVIQEFCIFAIVGLISDFFLQMMLFSTILAMDIKRVEFSDLRKVSPAADGSAHKRIQFRNSTITSSLTINRSRSHPKLTALDNQPLNNIATASGSNNTDHKIPRRLRIVNFWARTRFFQRAFMIWMIVWIFSIIYNSRIFEQIFIYEQNGPPDNMPNSKFSDVITNFIINNSNAIDDIILDKLPSAKFTDTTHHKTPKYADEGPFNITEQINKLRHADYDTHYYLSNFHWSSILRQYNISLSGKYVTILPAIKLAHVVAADIAVHIRNTDEKTPRHFQWKALAVALDPIDFSDIDTIELPQIHHQGSTPLYPKSPMEILLAAILCSISVFVLTYTMVVFYRCICTRNYAEWRASWNDTDVIHPKTQRILEGVPIQVKGHAHRIECLVTDGVVVASSCLEGQVKIWDANNGELISNINRSRYFQLNNFNNITNMGRQIINLIEEKSWSPIWCLDYVDNLIVIGCADGRIEFWEASTGNLKVIFI